VSDEELVKVTVFLTAAAYEDLEKSSYAEAFTRTDVINRAIGVYAAIGAGQPGHVITINNRDGDPWKSVLILGRRRRWVPWRRRSS
jgi:hypothetical protein